VLATEISKTPVKSAQLSIARNNVANLILRMSAEEFTEAMNKVRSFRRLEESGVDLDTYDCHTVLVDPPRAGLDDATLKMIWRYDNIVYVSCNPVTLMENLKVLTETHVIDKLAFFDQFPYTRHTETVALLLKE
jgi:tRNA (uracil-5-)-methyltransferase